ncbi:MAG: AAA family ATPase [Chloroflexi bacterium]|nr:AAA family ATPase [Chloroflexota bacterium]
MQPGARVRVYTLGTFRVVVDGCAVEDTAWRRRTARQLFKVLLTRQGRSMSRDEVIELFWPDSDSDAAASNLRSAVHAMRRALQAAGPGVVFGDHTSLWLAPESSLWTDATYFEELVSDAWRSADPLPLLEHASSLYAGDYLPDDVYEDWATERREVLRRTWTELAFGLAQALESRGDVNAALQPLERLLRADPCDERAAQALMQLLTRFGRRAEALRVFQRLAQSLRDDLDVEPSRESVELQRQISAGESVAQSPIPAVAFRCTYPFPTPRELVGRESELAVLCQVLASGRTAGQVALLSAPEGIGKSAMLGQIVRQAQAQGALCLAGGCYAERGAVPFGPFHDALIDFFLAQRPQTLRAHLGSSIEDVALVIPELRYQLELPAPAAAPVDHARAFGAIHACLRGLAERDPVVLCLEDLHTADEPTLQLLHYLARQTRRLPFVLLATYQEDGAADQLLGQTVAALVRERLAQRLVLNPLGRDQTDHLVGLLLDGSPDQALGESVYATTGGNPLFVEELVLAMREAGLLEAAAGKWRLTGALETTPHIVREVIALRLQRLDSECREILAMASVLGRSFERRVLLAAMEPLAAADVLGHVDHAIRAHVLRTVRGGYAFYHALMREAVYSGMSGPRRRLLQARASEVRESTGSPA